MSSAALLETSIPGPRGDLRTRLEQALAGCSEDELLWASGFIAGLSARAHRRPVEQVQARAPAEAPRAAASLSILVGSQTGNGKALAQRALEQARAQGINAKVVNLADLNSRQLKQERAVLLIVSTHGDGDAPDDAEPLLRFLNGPQAARLERLAYAVIALGDSSYPHFCKTGRDFDARLEALGARRVAARVDCDVDYKASADAGIAGALSALAPAVAEGTAQARISLVEPGQHAGVAPVDATGEAAVEIDATVLLNQRITGRASSKDVRHLEFALDSAAFAYEPGDSVIVTPRNPPALVAELLETRSWPADAEVRIGEQTLTLASALADRVELTLLSRPVLAAIAERSAHPALHDALANASGTALADYMRERQLIDVLNETGVELTPQAFVDLARPLGTRAYSISSSRAATPDELHLTVAVVDGSRDGRPRPGCASGWLASREAGATVALRLERNQAFRLPRDDDTPIIMIGPGTGVAPFRAFVEERAARGAGGRSWLFFGERTQREDFLYQLEWQRHLRAGTLTRLDVAFSRDGAGKHYVQDRLRACAKDVYAWLGEGAAVYVCGDAQRMAKDVHRALLDVLAGAGGMTAEAAEEYLFELKRQGRYQRDVY